MLQKWVSHSLIAFAHINLRVKNLNIIFLHSADLYFACFFLSIIIWIIRYNFMINILK